MGEKIAYIVVLVLGACLCMLLEIVTPTFGVLLVIALLALGGAVYLAFTISATLAVILIIAFLILIPAYLVITVRLLPRSPLGRRLFLGKAPGTEADGTPEASRHKELVGKIGVAETALRPAGAVRIEGIRIVALAESSMIERGASVKVIKASGSNVVVRKIDSGQ